MTVAAASTTMKNIAAINVYKKVTVARRSSDTVTYEDSEGNIKTVKDLGEVASAAVAPSLVSKVKLDIPTPRIVNVDSYQSDMPPNYKPPMSYIRYRKPDEHDLEYVADAEDEVWLINNTKFGADNQRSDPNGRRRPQVTLAMLERSLDLLEKHTGFETICLEDRAERLILSKIPLFLHHFPYKAPAGVITAKHVVGDIYSYWVQKRSKLKRPLLRRFWPVTATDDTNPHLVFRPREKEKYKLRKKRQNDMDAYRKMKQLRSDFQHVRVLLDLVKRREELNRCLIQLQLDWFEQKLSDIVDTSSTLRSSSRLHRNEVERLLDVPRYFNVTGAAMGNKKKKRKRGSDWDDLPFEPSTMPQVAFGGESQEPRSTAPAPPQAPANVAGKNHGEPAPLFVHPLKTRESYVTSWDNAVPLVTSYVNTHAAPTFRFRHRPRLGRGGRICIDRIPHPVHPNITPMSTFTAGDGLVCSIEPKKQLLDLLPRPLDHAFLSRKIEEMCVAAIQEDYETATIPTGAASASLDPDENDCEEVLVKLNDWLDTDEQLWGEERFAIGPL